MGEDGFSIEDAYRVVSKSGPIETYKRDVNKVGAGKYWMYTEEYFYPRQCKFIFNQHGIPKAIYFSLHHQGRT